MSSKRNFLDTMHFFYSFGKLFGLSCYTLSQQQLKYRVSFGVTDFFQLIAFNAMYVTLIYWNWINEWNITNDEKDMVIFNRGQKILIIVALLFLVAGTFQILMMRQLFCDIANLLNGIDHQMMQLLKIQINHNNLYRNTLMYVTVSYITLAVVFSCLAYYFVIIGTGMTMQYVLSYWVSNVAFVFIALEFQVILYSVYLRFSIMNRFVESNMLQTTNRLFLSSEILEFQKHIFTIAKITDQLNNVATKLCYYFAPTMICALSGVFCITVFNFHNFYRTINRNNTYEFYVLILTYDLLSLLFSIWLFLCVAACSFGTSAAKKMGVLVHKIVARTRDQHVIRKLKVLSQQILHRSPNFSLGLYSLDWPFTFTYIASVVSYIVILIQFENYIADSPITVTATNS